MRRALLFLPLLLACQDSNYSVTNEAPVVALLDPIDQQEFSYVEAVTVLANILDRDDAPDDLWVQVSSDIDELLGEGNPDGEGSFSLTQQLSVGDHILMVEAVDPDGASGSESVVIHVLGPSPPEVEIIEPLDNAPVYMGNPTLFTAQVSDDVDASVDLLVSWTSDLEIDPLWTSAPDDQGKITFTTDQLSGGVHTIVLEVTDLDGLTGSDAITLYVNDPGDVDQDGDGFTPNTGDCNDLNATVYPGAPELCDMLDNDCDTVIPADESDNDSDGQPPCDGDCDDSDPFNYLGNAELCDGWDNDCNGSADMDPAGEVDADGDGWMSCDGDCDDSDPGIHPGVVETCNGIDDDCDGVIPPGEVDADFDGQPVCGGDCDDFDPQNFSGNPELCDGGDNDCNGLADFDASGETDVDGDGFRTCDGDCDDTNSTVYPTATDVCDMVDNNCDGHINEPYAGPYEMWETSANSPGYSLSNQITPSVVLGSGSCSFPDPFFGLPMTLVPGTSSVSGVFSAPDDLYDIFEFQTDFLSGVIDLAAFLLAAGQMQSSCFIGEVSFNAVQPVMVTVDIDGTPYSGSGTSGTIQFTLNLFQLFGANYRVIVQPMVPWSNCQYTYNLSFTVP